MTTYDCSQPLETGMPVYPGTEPAAFDVVSTVPEDGARVRRLECTSHVGTHLGAPAHMVAGGATLDEFDVGDFVFDALLVDCTDAGPREALAVADLPRDLRDDPGGTDADALLFQTGWDAHWGTDRYRDSPFLAPTLAAWCAEHSFHVGIDAFSPDPVPSAAAGGGVGEGGTEDGEAGADDREAAPRDGEAAPGDGEAAPGDGEAHPAHAALCGADRLIVENLRGLSRLPDRVELSVLPLRIAGGDGSPVRAVARPR